MRHFTKPPNCKEYKNTRSGIKTFHIGAYMFLSPFRAVMQDMRTKSLSKDAPPVKMAKPGKVNSILGEHTWLVTLPCIT